MLSYQDLVDLYRDLSDREVLSVYINAKEHDPAKRRAWRRRLEDGLAAVRRELSDDAARRKAFDAAAAKVEEALSGFESFLPGRGWVAFATPDELRYAKEVPVPMPDAVRWQKGLLVAPYVRGLKQNRPVIAALLDRRHARLYRYQAGTLGEPVDLRSDTGPGDATETAATKRAMDRSGRRGATAADTTQRAVDEGARRLLGEVIAKAEEMMGADGFLVLGGTPEMVAAAAKRISRPLVTRTLERPSLYLDMPAPELKDALEPAASELTIRWQSDLLEDVIDQARSGGRGSLGLAETQRALRESRVETLLIARSLREHDDAFADQLVGEALRQGAAVEELSGKAGERLAAEANGTGARLRYRRPDSPPAAD